MRHALLLLALSAPAGALTARAPALPTLGGLYRAAPAPIRAALRAYLTDPSYTAARFQEAVRAAESAPAAEADEAEEAPPAPADAWSAVEKSYVIREALAPALGRTPELLRFGAEADALAGTLSQRQRERAMRLAYRLRGELPTPAETRSRASRLSRRRAEWERDDAVADAAARVWLPLALERAEKASGPEEQAAALENLDRGTAYLADQTELRPALQAAARLGVRAQDPAVARRALRVIQDGAEGRAGETAIAALASIGRAGDEALRRAAVEALLGAAEIAFDRHGWDHPFHARGLQRAAAREALELSGGRFPELERRAKDMSSRAMHPLAALAAWAVALAASAAAGHQAFAAAAALSAVAALFLAGAWLTFLLEKWINDRPARIDID